MVRSSIGIASNIYETNVETWRWKKILWTVKVGEVIDDDTCSNIVRMIYVLILLVIIIFAN